MPDTDLQKTIRETEQDMRGNANPDILSCIANLSNDEVFTPPTIANDVLDLLPHEIWSDPTMTFLDPCAKTGVFLREIVKRLDVGLAEKIPNAQERVNHILKNQVFGIGITGLTALMARRTVYCSKTANGTNSLCTEFNTADGNIKFDSIRHTWNKQGKCHYCGASKQQFNRNKDLETHAYQFIHTENPQELFKMKFDVIIGNPPYQVNCGGGANGVGSISIYHKFVEQAQKLNPRYLSMIIPARWYTGGKGLDTFRKEMLNDESLRVLVDYTKATDCFGKEGADFEGGVCYFLWDRDNKGDCLVKTMDGGRLVNEIIRSLKIGDVDLFIRDYKAVAILNKINEQIKETERFSSIVSQQTPFGLHTNFRGKAKEFENSIQLHTSDGINYIKIEDVPNNHHWIDKYKVYVSKSYGERGKIPAWVIGKPFIGEPNTCCTQTYLLVGTFNDKKTAENVQAYMSTKLFRFIVHQIKVSQDAMRKVYNFVPIQDFNETWTDEKLYKKYNLTQKEINYIESMIKPMEISDAD